MGGSPLQKKQAVDIANKLKADIVRKTNHDIAIVRWQGFFIGSFGIRRDRYAGHGHIPGQIFITQSEALQLARCHMSKDDYFDILRQRGVLPAEC